MRVNLLSGMTQGLRHSPAEFWLLPGELCEREDSVITDGILLWASFLFQFRRNGNAFSICVIKVEKKCEHGSIGLSCNPVFQTLFWAPRSLCAIVFSKFTSCNLESARTRGTPSLSRSLTKDCAIPGPAVFCSSFKGLRLPTELRYVLCLQQI